MNSAVIARWRLRALAAVCAIVAAPAIAADTTPPPIRQFDIPTIEKLGREMYEQDQEAWKATDILRAKVGDDQMKADKLHGWIVESLPDRSVVRFVHDGTDGPEAYYDVVFPKAGGEPSLSPPATRALSAEEAAQYSARTLALKGVDQPCSQNYNTIVLKDPERNGWLAWALAATTDPNLVVMGRHYRFTISADGKNVIEKDALSLTCREYPKPEAKPGMTFSGLFENNVVSLSPIETQVFASLSYNLTVDVGTGDGKAWRISQGQVTPINQDSPAADGFSARTFAGMDERCKLILTKPDEVPAKYYVGPETKVIERTEHDDTFAVDAPSGSKAAGIVCGRDDLVPSPNDYKVVLAGYHLSIFDRGIGHPDRMATLQIADGKFQFQPSKGEAWTSGLKARIDARLAGFQSHLPANH